MGQSLDAKQGRDPDIVIPLIEKHYKQGTSQLVQLLDYMSLEAEPGDHLERFITKINRGAEEINLNEMTNWPELVKIVILMKNVDGEDIKRQLLVNDPTNFQELCKMARSYDQANKTLIKFKGKSSVSHVSTYKRGRSISPQPEAKRYRARSPSPVRRPEGCSGCYRCGEKHQKGDCYAKDRECYNCGKKGHIAKACFKPPQRSSSPIRTRPAQERSDIQRQQTNRPERVNDTREDIENEISNFEVPCTEELGSTLSKPLPLIDIVIYSKDEMGVDIQALPDTGANINVLPLRDCGHVGIVPQKKKDDNSNPLAADGRGMPTYGRFKLRVRHEDEEATLEFVVADTRQCILSQESLKLFELIPKEFPHVKVNNKAHTQRKPNKSSRTDYRSDEAQARTLIDPLEKMRREFPTVFDQKCTPMTGEPIKIEVDEQAIPVKAACRSVPEPLMPELAKELKKLEEQGIISKVEKAATWLHPIVVVPKKDGGIRLCVDFKKLNVHVKRPINPQPTPKEIVQKIPTGMTCFTVFDALKGYHQIPLDEESKELTTFITPLGQFQYNRLPFGLNLAGDVFTSRYGKAVDHVEGMTRIVEDTLIYAPDQVTMNRRIQMFLEAAKTSGITLNLNKIQYSQPEVSFGGFVISSTGYKPNAKLLQALSEFPTPVNRTDMKSFFGLANQLSQFKPELSEALTPLKDLLKTRTPWLWLPHHEEAFKQAREILSSVSQLNYYNPSRPVRIAADASRLNGLGFIMKQQEKDHWIPVQAGSRMLTDAERNYAMVELELLAIQWACKKCEAFIYGLPHFEITTDHKPLIPILNEKCLNQIENKRLQRLRSKLDHLNYTATYIKGSLNYEADALSRAPIDPPEPEEEDAEANGYEQISEVIQTNESNTWAEIIQASEDELSANIRKHVINGWPEDKMNLTADLWPYWKANEKIWINEENLLVCDGRLIIPKKLRRHVMDRLKALHLGPLKTYKRARSSFWWPELNAELKHLTKECETCQKHAPSVPKTSQVRHEEATRPSQYIHADLCEVSGHHFLVSVDQYSGWLWITYMGKALPNSSKLIEAFLMQFQTGLPDILYTDGATMFTSEEFKQFAQTWNFKHITSSPHYPQSNGYAEEAVKDAKRIIRPNITASGVEQNGIRAALLGHRNTPKRGNTAAPSQKLLGRFIKDCLPDTQEKLTKLWDQEFTAREREAKKNDNTKPAARFTQFKEGDRVYLQNPKTKEWDTTGTIKQAGINAHEWLIQTDAGAVYRRNHHFLRKEEIKAWIESSTPRPWAQGTSNEKQEIHKEKMIPETKEPEPRSILKRTAGIPARYVQSVNSKKHVRFQAPDKEDKTSHEGTRMNVTAIRPATVFNPKGRERGKKAYKTAKYLEDSMKTGIWTQYGKHWYMALFSRWKKRDEN